MSYCKFKICHIDVRPRKLFYKMIFGESRVQFLKSILPKLFFLHFCSHAKAEEASSLLYTWLRYSCMNLSAPSVPAVLKK